MGIWLRVLTILLSLCFVLSGCADDEESTFSIVTEPDETTEPVVDQGELVLLFTGDLRNSYAYDEELGRIGYAALEQYHEALEDAGHQVILLDGGDAVGGDGAGSFESGDALWDIVNSLGYDIRVPGVLELSEGVGALRERTKTLTDSTYISCNLIHTGSDATVFDPYVIVDVGNICIGFVGITSPGSTDYIHSDYTLCQTNDGRALYDAVQKAIDDAADAGADYVIALGNLGTDPVDSPWTSAEVIANTTGLAAFLDCGSGSVIEGSVVEDKDSYEIPVCAVGSEFHYVGQVTLNLNDGSAAVTLLDVLGEEDNQIKALSDDLTAQMDAATEPTVESTESTGE